MLKYLIIPLAEDAESFCHYSTSTYKNEWISPEVLQKAVHWAMKENLSIQFLFPKNPIPEELGVVMDSIDYTSIVPFDHANQDRVRGAEVVVVTGFENLKVVSFRSGQAYVVKTSLAELITSIDIIKRSLPNLDRLNIVIDNIAEINEVGIDEYKRFLESLIPSVVEEYRNGHIVQLNLLTDRLMLSEMNNCNAGNESLTLAPDGNFYICPAFYNDGEPSIGNLENGKILKNPHLYKLSYAPICRICDAYQCKRCIWMNKKYTLEVNTPSREQCLVGHIERNASKILLQELRKIDPSFLSESIIPEIDYLDPFEKLQK